VRKSAKAEARGPSEAAIASAALARRWLKPRPTAQYARGLRAQGAVPLFRQCRFRCLEVALHARRCSQGLVGDPCDDVGDCTTARCVGSACTTGEVEAPCQGDADCIVDYCAELPGQRPDQPKALVCADGRARGPCNADTQCASGYCVAQAGA